MFYSILHILISLIFVVNSEASESLSYSGRLVNSNGSPVAGPVNLKVELAYSNNPTAILCSQDFTNIILSNGVFHLKVDFDCGSPVTLSQVLSQIPANESAAIRVTDVTHSKAYSFQAMHSMPFANISETAKQLFQMGAADGQVLKWNNTNSKWEPGSPGGGGTVTNVTASAPLAVSSGASTPVLSITKATTSSDGYLSAADWNAFNTKVGVATGGTTAQYYRGDNSWQTLNSSVVPESGVTNLYFSNARVLGVPLDGFVAGPGVIAATDTVLQAFSKAQGQINSLTSDSAKYLIKNATDSITGVVTVASPTGFLRLIDPPAIFTDATNMAYVDSRDDLKVNKSGDVMTGDLTLNTKLLLKGGANYVTLKAHATTANTNFIFPQTAGTNGFVLATDGSGNTSWVDSAVNSASIVNGSIVDADINAAAAIAQSKIANLSTDLAGKEPTITNPADTTKYYRGDKSWQTLNTSAVPEVTNLYFTNARVLGTDLAGLNTGVAGPITAADTVLSAFGKLQNQTTDLKAKGQWDKNVNDIYYNTGNVGIGTTNPGSALEVKGVLRLAGSTSGYVGLSPAAVAGSTTYTLPAADGSAGQLLKTNGAGVLSWVNDNTGAGAFTGAINNAVITDGTGALSTSATTATELGYVSGVSSSIQTQLNAKQTTILVSGNILVGNGSNVATAVTPTSDVSMTNAGAFTVTKLQGKAVSTTAPGVGSVLKWDNVLSQWTPIPFATCAGASQVMHYNVVTDTWSCDSISLNNLLPTQTANSGKFLSTDGTTSSWQTVNATPAGANGQVQFNNSGVLGASANLLWDSVNSYLGIGASTPQAPLHVAGAAIIGSATTSYTGTNAMVLKNSNGLIYESPAAALTRVSVNGSIYGIDQCSNASCTSLSPILKLGVSGGSYLELTNGPLLRLGTTNNLGPAGISIGTAWGDSTIGVVDASGPTNLTIKASGTTGALSNIAGGTLNLVAGASSGTGTSKIDFKTATAGASGATVNNATTKMTITGSGAVGIGTATPGAQLEVAGLVKITGGTPGAGKVLTSDAAGLATWTTPAAGGITSLNGLAGTTQAFAIPGTAGTAPNWSSAGTDHTINIPMAATAGVTAGLISKTDYDAFNSKLGTTLNSGNIWVGNGSNAATAVTPSSDVSMTNAGAFTVTKLQGKSVSTTAPVLGSFLKWDNILSQWAPTPLATCSGTNEVMHYILLTDTWSCDTLNIDNLLPTQTANSGKVLTTNGTTANWQTPSAPPAGANFQVQYNNNGVMGANSNLVWFNGSSQLAIGYAGSGTSTAGTRFTVDKTYSPSAGGSSTSTLASIGLTFWPTVAHSVQGGALKGSMTSLGAEAMSGSGFGGVEGSYRHNSTGAMTGTAYGVMGMVSGAANNGNLTGKSIGVQGKIFGSFGSGLPSYTEALGVQSSIDLGGSVTGGTAITTAVGFQSEANTAAFDTISTLIGLKVKAPTGGGTVTNKYAILTEAGAGNVGIGTITPGTNTALNVAGQIKSGSASITTGSVDWVSGNSITTTFDCGTNITLANLRDGGSYTLVVTGTGTTQCSFSTSTTGDDAATVTYRFKPANGVRTASSHTVYSLLRIGTIVYVSWISGF